MLNFTTIKWFLKLLQAKSYFKIAAGRHLELQEPAKNTSLVSKILFILALSPFQRHIIQHAITKTATGNLLLPDYYIISQDAHVSSMHVPATKTPAFTTIIYSLAIILVTNLENKINKIKFISHGRDGTPVFSGESFQLFLGGGGKLVSNFSMPPDYWNIEKNSTLYVVIWRYS